MGALRGEDDEVPAVDDWTDPECRWVYAPRHRRVRPVRLPAEVRAETLACFAAVEGQEGD